MKTALLHWEDAVLISKRRVAVEEAFDYANRFVLRLLEEDL